MPGAFEPLPPVSDGNPAPGKRVRQFAPEFKETALHHMLYLPTDWKPGRLYPVIVEYSGNNYMPVCTGEPDGCRLGYYQSGGAGFIWVVMPYVEVDHKKNAPKWWGDLAATVAYCKTNLRRICENFGGDPNAIFITGFSRGAIACGFVGLHDDEIADIWLGFIPHSFHDGGRYTKEGAVERLARVKGRPSFITFGETDDGKQSSLDGASILKSLNCPANVVEIANLEHTDAFITVPCPERDAMRTWIAETLTRRPGTATIAGRVVDAAGKGLANARIQSGWHWTFSDERGEYSLPGLILGQRTVSVSKDRYRFMNQTVTLTQDDATNIVFRAD